MKLILMMIMQVLFRCSIKQQKRRYQRKEYVSIVKDAGAKSSQNCVKSSKEQQEDLEFFKKK